MGRPANVNFRCCTSFKPGWNRFLSRSSFHLSPLAADLLGRAQALLAADEAKQEVVARESGLLTAGSFRFCVRMLLAAFIWCGALQIFGAVLGRNEISL